MKYILQTRVHIMLLLAVAVMLLSCESSSSTTTTQPSSDPTLASLTFRTSTEYPALANAVFTIEEPTDAGLVYNIDSIDYGTAIDSVVPYFRFNATPAAVVVYYSDMDSFYLTGSDTINFTYRPLRMHVTSGDLSNHRWYNIYVNVHQVDPDLFNWYVLQNSIYTLQAGEQKAFILGDKFFLYTSDGLSTYIHSSADGTSWQQESATFPLDCHPQKMLFANDAIVVAAGDKVYTTTDGLNFTSTDLTAESYTIENMLYYYADSIWAIAQQKTDGTYHFALSADGQTWTVQTEVLPQGFPLANYATATFRSKSYRERAIVVGGFDAEGNCLNSSWTVEALGAGNYRWTNYAFTEPATPRHSMALVEYDDKLYMFGGADDRNQLLDDILESDDEGLTWVVPDTAHNILPATYMSRMKHSVLVHDKYIYIIGGQSKQKVLSDVYRGRLNSIDF